MRALAASLLVVATVTGCRTEYLPPPNEPAAPEATTPTDGNDAGVGRVSISTDVPARVERLARVEGVKSAGTLASLLCDATPCEATLPYGDYDLRFTGLADPGRESHAVLVVRRPAVALRHVLGQNRSGETQVAGGIVATVGVVALFTAAGFAASATPTNPSNGPSPSSSPNPAPYIAGGGLVMLALGLVLSLATAAVHQDGATTQSSSGASPEVGGASFGLRF